MITFLLHSKVLLHVFLNLLRHSMLGLQFFYHPNLIGLIILHHHYSLDIITALQLVSHRIDLLLVKSHGCFALSQLFFFQFDQRVFIVSWHSLVEAWQAAALLVVGLFADC